jgi:hypothetical protein
MENAQSSTQKLLVLFLSLSFEGVKEKTGTGS